MEAEREGGKRQEDKHFREYPQRFGLGRAADQMRLDERKRESTS